MKYKLDDIDKKEVFEVPEGYFEDLPMKIQSKIAAQKQHKSLWVGSWAWQLAVAASLVLIALFVFIIPSGESKAEKLLAEVSEEELVAYLDYLEVDEYDLAQVMEGTDAINPEEINILQGIEIEDQMIDDVLMEYNLEEEYL